MDTNMNLNVSYPKDDNYDYFVTLDKLNLDEECRKDLSNQHGFIIREPQQINKTVKSEWGIFSSKFGSSMMDDSSLVKRFSCERGCTQGSFYAVPNNANWVCPHCGTEVKLVGDDFTFFGWIVLKDKYAVIHPTMYILLQSLIGKNDFNYIIEPDVELDINGNPISMYDKRIMKRRNTRKFKTKSKLDSMYSGIGLIGFREHFQEIIDYFYKKKPQKKAIYDEIMLHKDKVFTHSIPVYTTQLRIAKVENKRFTFEKTNADFNMIAKLVATINKDELSIYRNRKYQNQLLWDIQNKLNSLVAEVYKILGGKKGIMRSTITGRIAFSARIVIVPDPGLKMDEISLPYYALVILLEQIIINILQSSYNITYAQAYKMWYYSVLNIDQKVLNIIEGLIKMDKIHILLNRPPSISSQSLVWKRVVKCNTDSIVMGVDQFILKGMNGDFDGDTLSLALLLNKQFDQACERVYSPRNTFCISRNDGMMNDKVNIFKDTIVNFNALLNMTRPNYSPAQLANIEAVKKMDI